MDDVEIARDERNSLAGLDQLLKLGIENGNVTGPLEHRAPIQLGGMKKCAPGRPGMLRHNKWSMPGQVNRLRRVAGSVCRRPEKLTSRLDTTQLWDAKSSPMQLGD
jgi:hypothetical protein